MIEYVKKGLDWIEKFMKRFKALGYLIAIVFVIIYFVNKGFEKKEAIRIAEKITGLNLERDLLLEEKEGWRKDRTKLQDSIYYLKEERDSILKEKEKESRLKNQYRRERDKALQAITDFTPTERYVFLDETAYPYIGDKIYPFNANQLEGIHTTYVENEGNKKLLASTERELNDCNEALAMTVGIEAAGEEVEEMMEEEIKATEAISAINEEKAEIAMKQWKKERRKRIWGKVEKWVYGVGGFVGGFFLGGK